MEKIEVNNLNKKIESKKKTIVNIDNRMMWSM